MNKKRACFYARVSSEKELQLNALDNQLKWYDNYEQLHADGYTFQPERYIDRGITGTAAKKRPAFLRMLEDAAKHKFDVVITREVSRFARNTVESLVYTRKLAELGIEVFFVNDNIHSLNPEDSLRLQLMSMLAEEESRRDSERCRAGLSVAKRNGTSVWGNGNILGYTRPGGTGTDYVIDPEQAETVTMIKDWFLYEGMSLGEIKRRLEIEKRRTATGKTKWFVSTISRILHNPFYMGMQEIDKEQVKDFLSQKRERLPKEKHILIPTHCPTIMTPDEYWKIQEKLAKASISRISTSKGEEQVKIRTWTRKLVCKCGASYVGWSWRTRKGGESIGYACNNRRLNGSTTRRETIGLSTEDSCDMSSVAGWKLELMAKKILEKLWTTKGKDVDRAFEMIRSCYSNGSTERVLEIKKLDDRINKHRKRLERLKEMRLDGDLDREEYHERKTSEEEQLKLLEKQRRVFADAEDAFEILDAELADIKESLNGLVDFSKPVIDIDVIDKFVEIVHRTGESSYDWFMKLSLDSKWYLSVPSEADQIKIVKKNHAKPIVIIKDRRRYLFTEVITFEEAKKYRKECGTFARAYNWNDLTFNVYSA